MVDEQLRQSRIFHISFQEGILLPQVSCLLEERAALWFSQAGDEIVQINEPLRRPIQKIGQLPSWLRQFDQDSDRNPGHIPHSADG